MGLYRKQARIEDSRVRVLIVDDHEVVRRGVRSLVQGEANFEVCGEAADGREAVGKVRELEPDIVVMDISMPTLNGLEATREIRRIRPATKVLMLSQHNILQMMKQAVRAGANGYVLKSAITRELVAAMEKVWGGESYFNEGLTEARPDIDSQEILQRSRVFELALRESNERLRLAQQIARVGTFELNVKTGSNRWTPEMESLYGLRAGSFAGTQSAWEALIHPQDRQETVNSLKRVFDEGGCEAEWRVVWPDGSIHWLLGRMWLFRDENGEPDRLVGANIDITERKRSEQRAEREARLLDLSFDAIVVRDTRDCIRYWNRGAKELYGWEVDEAAGRVTHDLLQTKLPEALEAIFAVLRKNGRWEGELTHTCKDGRRVTVMSRWAMFRDWERGEDWVLETNTDITKRKPTEEDVRKATGLLENQIESKKDLGKAKRARASARLAAD
jgi:PAS domain S-box-containing protein